MRIKHGLIFILATGQFFLFSCKKSGIDRNTNGLITYYSNKNGNYNIFVMKSDGTRQHQLTNEKSTKMCGVWSPDGKKMIFSTDRDGDSEIFIMDAYGNRQKRLTDNSTDDYHHRWSPDSKQIVFVATRDGNQEIYIMDVDGKNQKNITNSEINEMFPCWSPDGKTILYCSEEEDSWKIYRMDVDGSNRKKVSKYNGPDWEIYPQYSRNGKKIVYFTHEPEKQIRNIFVMNKNGNNRKQLTFSESVDEDPYWSPDGKYIVFQSNRKGNFQIFKMKADGTEQTCLSNNKNNEYWPSWSWIKEY